ncbi:MAG: hypothetical protein IJ719_08045 [Clostridia bacterium]|nr:hypothetical protein [Clostridia bacterium]
MKEHRYVDDWVNEVTFDEKGRERRVPVYRGDYFVYDSQDEKPKRLKYALAIFAAYVLFLMLYFCIDLYGTRVMAVFLPMGVSLFPALYWGIGAFSILREPPKMTRAEKEKGPGRILRSAGACMMLMVIAAVADLVMALMGGYFVKELPGILLLAAASLAAIWEVRYFDPVVRRIHALAPANQEEAGEESTAAAGEKDSFEGKLL